MPGPGYLPVKKTDNDAATTLSKLPLSDLLNVITQAKMPPSSTCEEAKEGSNVQSAAHPPRPTSARGLRPTSARGSRPPSASRPQTPRRSSDGNPEFVRHVSHGRPFSPRVEFLEAKIVGNGSQWDQERLLMPERAFPCIAKGAAEFHDRNAERENRPAWKPTSANKVSGMGVAVDAAFPLPPRPLSALRPRTAARTPRGLR